MDSYAILFGAAVILALLVVLTLRKKQHSQDFKQFLFSAILIFVAAPTLYITAATVYKNVVSASNGPVHWHADFEIWNCGQQVNLKDPDGRLSNKIGTATLHEHNDNRIHVEGVAQLLHDASLGEFFHVVGGELTSTSVTIPTNAGPLPLTNGSICGNGLEGKLQVFVYQTDQEGYYMQKKLTDPQNYVISPYTNVPEGDCVIVEFGQEKDKTEHLCRSYDVAKYNGTLKGEKQ
jgi:hypothetical protein